MTNTPLYNVELFAVLLLVWGAVLALLVRKFMATRSDIRIGTQVAVAFVSRVVAALAVSLTSLAAGLRDGDEPGFVFFAHRTARTPLDSTEFLQAFTHRLYEWVFAVQIKLVDAPEDIMRVTQVGLTTIGILLIVVAVHDLAGAKASRLAAWLLAMEPANMFFSSLLHKEPNMFLAEGLVAYGGARLWSRGSLFGALPMTAGCLIAVATRPYAGWFLVAASAAIMLHTSFRASRASALNAMVLFLVVAAGLIVSLPTVLNATSPKNLSHLQESQKANASDKSNLALERVNYSTRGDVVRNLPKRVSDVLLRPYPWQVANPAQRLGVLGTLVVYALIMLLALSVARHWGAAFSRAGPLIYLALMLLIAYSLSAGNAGTAFRYRTHVVTVAIGLLVVLRATTAAPAAVRVPEAEGPANASLGLT